MTSCLVSGPRSGELCCAAGAEGEKNHEDDPRKLQRAGQWPAGCQQERSERTINIVDKARAVLGAGDLRVWPGAPSS